MAITRRRLIKIFFSAVLFLAWVSTFTKVQKYQKFASEAEKMLGNYSVSEASRRKPKETSGSKRSFSNSANETKTPEEAQDGSITHFLTDVIDKVESEVEEMKEMFHKYTEDPDTYSNPEIISNGCSVTILIIEPRLTQDSTSAIWYALESMAVNVQPINTTCVVLMTSHKCTRKDSLATLKEEIIQSHARENFRSLIDRGNVRFHNVDSTKYFRYSGCKWNVNRILMHPTFWDDDFTAEDSDHVLLLQHDSVFCHTFNISLWNDLAFVGGVWPPRPGMHNNPWPKEGSCNALKNRWNEWKPGVPFPEVCANGLAPVGNGGFSLRSRHWMKVVIDNCPSPMVARIKPDCRVRGDIAEDEYFATGMRGFGAPMPNAIEAALFGVEMIFLETVMQYYPNENENVTDIVEKRWGDVEKYKRMSREGRTIPIGLHKPWWYHDRQSVLLSDQMKRECPYLEHILG